MWYLKFFEVDCFDLIGADVEVPEIFEEEAGGGGLVDVLYKIEGDVKPGDWYFLFLLNFFEVEMAELFKEVIAGIDSLHI